MAQIKIKSSFVSQPCKDALKRLHSKNDYSRYRDLIERTEAILWLCYLSEEITLDDGDYKVLGDALFIYKGEQFWNEAQRDAFIANQKNEDKTNGA